MAEAPKVTIGFDNETKSLIRELIDAVKRLDDGVDLDQSFGEPRRLVEDGTDGWNREFGNPFDGRYDV